MCIKEEDVPDKSYASVLVKGHNFNLRQEIANSLKKFTPGLTFYCPKCEQLTLCTHNYIGNLELRKYLENLE